MKWIATKLSRTITIQTQCALYTGLAQKGYSLLPESHDILTTQPSQPDIHIIGAGSIGLLWAIYLTRANKPVRLITKAHESKQQAITFALNTHSPTQAYLIDTENSQSDSKIQTLLVCTKAHDAFAAISSCQHRMQKHCNIILLQNGMGYQQTLFEAFADHNFYAGISTEGALTKSAFSVIHTGRGSTSIGCIYHRSGTPNLQSVAKILENELTIHFPEDIKKLQWQKLLINCVINPLTVYFNCLNGELANNLEALRMKHALICECRLLMQALGNSQYLQNIDSIIDEVIRKTASNSSSMREDVLQQKKSEIDVINGYITSLAQKYNIHCPTHIFLVDFIKSGTQL